MYNVGYGTAGRYELVHDSSVLQLRVIPAKRLVLEYLKLRWFTVIRRVRDKQFIG